MTGTMRDHPKTSKGRISIRGVSKVYDPAGANVTAIEQCSFEVDAVQFAHDGR